MPETSNIEWALGIVLGKLDCIEDRLQRRDQAVKNKVEAHEKATIEVTTLRTKARSRHTWPLAG